MRAEPVLLDAMTGKQTFSTYEVQRSTLIDACERYDVPKSAIDEHLIALCQGNNFHPVRQWLENGKPWDGIKRTDAVIDTLNAREPEYARSIIKAWLISAIAALYEPIFITKLIPVLQGLQSCMKSAWVRRLTHVIEGALYEGSVNPDKPDSVRFATSAWHTELAELESTTQNETGKLKAFITKSEDVYRLPYAKSPTVKKRQSVFIGTVNGNGFLRDKTGNSRFAVIELAGKINIDRLNELLGWNYNNGRLTNDNSELLRQFWLEVHHDYAQGASWQLDEDTQKMQSRINDVYTDKGSLYEFIHDTYLNYECKTTGYWFTASELATRHGDTPKHASAWGKALSLLADEGLIKYQTLRARRKEYYLQLPANNDVS
nr:ATPase [Plesiomonas shigelloides]